MKVPAGKTEAEVLEAIEKTVSILAPSFVFGPYDVDDIAQQGRQFAVELMNRGVYDSSRPLENFLYRHIRNRLINFKRDRFRRSDPPCRACHSGHGCNATGKPCKKYAVWLDRNRAKSNLLNPLDIARVADEHESRMRLNSDVVGEAEIAELLARIDERLPADLRSDYLRIKAGVSVPRGRRRLVERAVKDIIGDV